jgi:hypothetical protein
MDKVSCPHCNQELTVDLNAVGTELVCPKCHVILRLAKDDDKAPLFDLRRLLPRKKVVVGLACAVALALIAFTAGFRTGVNHAHGNNRGVVQQAFGLFVAHSAARRRNSPWNRDRTPDDY